MTDQKNPQDIPTIFQRKLPDGKIEKLDASGKPVSTASASTHSSAGTLKTGDLPKNTTGYGKLGAAKITTYEQLRAATDQELKDAGLDDEQIAILAEVKNRTE